MTFPGDANDKPGSLKPIVQATAVVIPTSAFTAIEKTPGFEMVLTVIALLAIFMGRNRL